MMASKSVKQYEMLDEENLEPLRGTYAAAVLRFMNSDPFG
jgi:hypothetical protein